MSYASPQAIAKAKKEKKRQDDYAAKTKKHNDKTKSFGVGWGGEPPTKKLPANVKIRK